MCLFQAGVQLFVDLLLGSRRLHPICWASSEVVLADHILPKGQADMFFDSLDTKLLGLHVGEQVLAVAVFVVLKLLGEKHPKFQLDFTFGGLVRGPPEQAPLGATSQDPTFVLHLLLLLHRKFLHATTFAMTFWFGS